MLPGETVASGASGKCKDPGCPGADGPKVLQSGAGFYIGYFCDMCGPYSRESGYYGSAEEAAAALDSGEFGRPAGYKPGPMKLIKL